MASDNTEKKGSTGVGKPHNQLTADLNRTGSILTHFTGCANALGAWLQALIYDMADTEVVALALDYTEGKAFDFVMSILEENKNISYKLN